MNTIGIHPFDIAFQDQYEDGDKVEFYIDGPESKLYYGTIRGKANMTLVNFWIVELDEMIPTWNYSCITVLHTLMRLRGSNQPFPYENILKCQI